MRLFIAINFDEKTKSNILKVQQRLKNLGKGTFTRPDNLHLTLAFLGEVSEDRVGDLKSVIDSIAVPRMNLSFSHAGCFRGEDELWWIGLEDNKGLSGLQKRLVQGLKDAGFKPDAKRFRPHITLARRMHVGRIDSIDLLPIPFETQVDRISLMLSHQVDGKLTYTEVYFTS